MKKSRTYNSIINSLFGIIASFITIAVNFAVRMVFVRVLGDEINGLHSLFQSTTSVMALMETGISTAMIIHLYEPVKNNDCVAVRNIMCFYKRIYDILAIAFFVVGCVINIFLDKFITTTIDMRMVHIYFAVFTVSFCANYLTYHKRSILYAEQKNRISTIATVSGELIVRVLAIIAVIITKQYMFFLVLLIAEKIFSNVICIIYVNKKHPYLKNYKEAKIDNEKKKLIFRTIKPLFVNQIASTAQNSASSILISMLMGNISIVGYYGAYQYVIATVELIFGQIGGAFTSSFGNLSVEKNNERMKNVYFKTTYIITLLAYIFCSGFSACIQDFILLLFGQNYILPYYTVLILDITMFVYLMNIPVISIQNAMGLHGIDAKYMLLQAITAVIMGYIGGIYYGMNGILIGLNIPLVVFTMVLKGILVCKKAFAMTVKEYIVNLGVYCLEGGIILVIVSILIQQIKYGSHVIDLILKGMLSVFITLIVVILCSIRNNKYKYLLSVLGQFTGRSNR